MIRQNYSTQKTALLFQLTNLNQYLNTQNKTIYFILQKRQKNGYKKSLHMLIDIMDVLLSFKQRSRMLKKLAKRTRKLFADYDHDCIEIWENQLGQLEEVEQISGFWNFDQSPNEETKPRKAPRCLPKNFLMMSAPMKHLL